MIPLTFETDDLVTALGNVIQNQRRKLGYSQEELAQQSGLHRTYISEIERHSRNVSVKILIKIALALQIDPSSLLLLAEEEVSSREPTGHSGPPPN